MKILLLLLVPFALRAQCPIPTAPPTPLVSVISPYSIRFAVPAVQFPTAGYYAEREPEGGTFSAIQMGYPQGVFIDDQMLLPNSTFCYRTRAYANCGTSSTETDEVMITTPDGAMPYQGAPESPHDLTATMSNGYVWLQWTLGAFPAVAGQYQAIQIARSWDGGLTWGSPGTFKGRIQFYDTVPAGHVYLYRVRAFNGFGWATGYYGNCGVNNQTCGTSWSNIASILVL